MTLGEFLDSELVSTLMHCAFFALFLWFVFDVGKHIGFWQGYKKGKAENPTPHVVTVTEYIFDDKHIARIDPRDSNTLVLIDMKEKTISRIPLDQKLEKQELAKMENDK